MLIAQRAEIGYSFGSQCSLGRLLGELLLLLSRLLLRVTSNGVKGLGITCFTLSVVHCKNFILVDLTHINVCVVKVGGLCDFLLFFLFVILNLDVLLLNFL